MCYAQWKIDENTYESQLITAKNRLVINNPKNGNECRSNWKQIKKTDRK